MIKAWLGEDIKRAVGGLVVALAFLSGCAVLPPQRGDSGFRPAMPPTPPPPMSSGGAIFKAGYELAWFEDIKARRIGDILTILLVEKTNAQKSANTATARDTEIDIPNPTVFGGDVELFDRKILENNIESQTTFDGEGDSAQSNKLDGNIVVSVVGVLPNGNLLVQGEKWITINQGDEYIRLQGIVRPVDINTDNTVLSTKVGNAQIAYGGTGVLADNNRQGWLTRFFSTVIWPL